MGLAQVAETQAQLDPLLRAEGFTQGSVGARINALNVDPRYLYPNTDEGRTALLAYLNEVLADIGRGCRACSTRSRARTEDQPGAAGHRGRRAGRLLSGRALDGSRPGIYYINLKDTAEWPRWALRR